MSELKVVPISDIRKNPIALRTVDKSAEKYLGLVQSIKEKGILNTIVVRPQRDPETTEEYLELVDGLHRFSAAVDAGLTEVNVNIVPLDQDQMLESQIIANFHRIDTKPGEYSKQLRRILVRNPLMTVADLASNIGVSPAFIQQRLGLSKIEADSILKMIDDGDISLSNAFALAKLPAEEQLEWVERAVTEGIDVFGPAVNERVKEVNEAKRAGKDATPPTFAPVAHLRKMKEIKDECDSKEVAAQIAESAESKAEAFNLAVQWVLHLDPASVEIQEAKWTERQAEQAAKRAEKAEKKAKDKEEKGKKLQAEAAADQEAADAAKATGAAISGGDSAQG